MKICVIGGGINGLCCAWVLSQKGHKVHLYERNKLMNATSRSSSKLLHGGLRYLEHGSFRLVREALKERDAWLQRAPELTNHLRLVLPLYKHSHRKRWIVKLGLVIYDNLFRSSILPKSKWLDADTIKQRDPELKAKNLIGGYAFSDGQMDDYKLGLWVAEQVKLQGGDIFENTSVEAIDEQGYITIANNNKKYDRIINVCGPWAEQLLLNSKIQSPYQLDGVRGSHLILNKECKQAYLFEIPKEKRVFFVLPWKGKTLIGTTEEKQTLNESIICSKQERDYLLTAYNHYYNQPIEKKDIINSFAGIRPLLSSTKNPTQTTREYAIQRTGKLINVFGGKWTTALALANKVSQQVN